MLSSKRPFLSILLILISTNVSTNSLNPHKYIEVNAQKMVLILRNENHLFKTEPKVFKNKIKVIFEPMIDFNRVSASVMGKSSYLNASSEQRELFISVFKESLLDTYAETLAQWNDAIIETDHGYSGAGGKIISVRQYLKTSNEKYPIIYKLRKYKDGSHKIVNIIINGINLGQTFHNQFQSLALEFDNDIDLIILKWQSDFFADG